MTIDEAIDEACAKVGIYPPKARRHGRWVKADTLSGKNGKGDGRLIVHDYCVTACNWQTGEKATVWLQGKMDVRQRRRMAADIEAARQKARQDALRAAGVARALLDTAARKTGHPYLVEKGFRAEEALIVEAKAVRKIGGDYLVPDGGAHAVLVPARRGSIITSCQLIWETGAKKFLFGGEIGGAAHRISSGVDTWLCEGFATGLSVRAALAGMKVRATVLCCFSAANILTVSRLVRGRAFIAADNDKPLPQFDGLGTGEHYAKAADLPYAMPPDVGTDFNDMHMGASIFAVQRVLTSTMAQAARMRVSA